MSEKLHATKGSKQLRLLERWALAPDTSPLSGVPDLDYFVFDPEFESNEEDYDQPEMLTDGDEDELASVAEDDEYADDDEILRSEKERREEDEQRAAQFKAEKEVWEEEVTGLITGWFLENFETVPSDSSYDEYMWGGPFDVRAVVMTHFSDRVGDDEEVMNRVTASVERISTEWVPSGSKIEPVPRLVSPTTGEEAYERMRRDVHALKELLRLIPEQPHGIGHNRPPEPIDAFPLEPADKEELAAVLHVLEKQPLEPADKGEEAKQAGAAVESKMHKVRGWLARQGDTLVTEAAKEIGKEFGKWMPRAFWAVIMERMFSLTENISAWLKLVFGAM